LLLASPPEHTTALEVLRVAGWLHWCRAFAIGRGGGQKDLDAALNLLAPVYRQQPHAVPEAIGKFLDSNPPEAGNAPVTLSSRGRQLMRIAFDANDLVTLTTAINWLRDALAITSTEEPEHQEILEGLSLALGDRYKRTNNLADLDHAIDGFRQVIRASPSSSSSPNRALCLHYLAVALVHRHEHTGDL